MKTLVLPNFVFSEIVATVNRTRDGLETGVKLFGTVIEADASSSSRDYVVLAIAGILLAGACPRGIGNDVPHG